MAHQEHKGEKQRVKVLPWLKLKEETTVDKCTFWPFYRYSERVDSSVKEDLETLLKVFTHPVYGEEARHAVPESELTIISSSVGDPTDEREDPASALNALAFACIDGNKNGNCATSETFTLYTLEFSPGCTEVAYPRGGICRLGTADALGLKISECVIQVPDEVDTGYRPHYDPDLLSALSLAVSKKRESKDYMLIVRSLEYFLQAYRNDPRVQPEVRITLMAIAFETLLEVNGKTDFILKVGKLCDGPDEPKKWCTIRNPRGKPAKRKVSAKGVWAEDFHLLRDKIIHGLTLEETNLSFKGRGHFGTSVDFYRLCVRKKLETITNENYSCVAKIKGTFDEPQSFNDEDHWLK